MSKIEKKSLGERVLDALQIALESVVLARKAPPDSIPDLVWRAYARTELAIGITRLELDDLHTTRRERRSIFSPLANNLAASLAEIQRLLELTVEERRSGLILKSLATARKARDYLSLLVLEDRKKELQHARRKTPS